MRIFLTLFIVGISTVFAENGLPEHTVADESRLSGGVRIQINSDNENLTKEQCIVLINAYRSKGLPNGQVSVRKPSTVKELKSTIVPYCLDNFDGEGIKFNTVFHPDSK